MKRRGDEGSDDGARIIESLNHGMRDLEEVTVTVTSMAFSYPPSRLVHR